MIIGVDGKHVPYGLVCMYYYPSFKLRLFAPAKAGEPAAGGGRRGRREAASKS